VAIQQAEGANDLLTVAAGAGNDIVGASSLPAGIIRLAIDGGSGNDVIVGSAGADNLFGGDGDDIVVGGRGDDLALLGAGNDTFVWNPGDGSDTVEGQSDVDALIFNGANIAESIDIAANGGRVRFFRDIATVTMDLDDVERVDFHAFGGADRVTVNDLSGTDLSLVRIDLESALGSGTGDGALDQVTVAGTAGDDVIALSGVGTTVAIAGLAASTVIFNAEATDTLVINAGAGSDVIDATGVAPGSISLTLNGGLGADVFLGSGGNDLVAGGDGDDTALLGAGNDTFVWNPGDDNDIVEGQAGFDTLVFNGANIAERIDISANGGRVLFTRDVASVVMDLNDVDRIDFHAFGGADRVTVHDLSGTDLAGGMLVVDLASFPGSGVGDGAADAVTVEATAGDDVVSIGAVGATIGIGGTPAAIAIQQAEGANDALTIAGGAGNDVIGASGVAAGTVSLTLDGGAGNDALIGGQGNDIMHGGADNDILFGNAGIDSMFGEAGVDTFAFTGTSFATLDTGVGAARDVVQDFAPEDVISLLNIDADFATSGDQAFAFIGTAAFSAAGQVRFFSDGLGNTIVEGNVDGNLAVDFQIELHNFNAALQANNFVL
jgi:Ca2+-binding RTX toxin-like protein